VIERLWDFPEFEAQHRERAPAEARRWDLTSLADQYQEFFQSLASKWQVASWQSRAIDVIAALMVDG
jgi:hypothetical protein